MKEQLKPDAHWQKYRKQNHNKWNAPLQGNPFGFITYERTPSFLTNYIFGNFFHSLLGEKKN